MIFFTAFLRLIFFTAFEKIKKNRIFVGSWVPLTFGCFHASCFFKFCCSKPVKTVEFATVKTGFWSFLTVFRFLTIHKSIKNGFRGFPGCWFRIRCNNRLVFYWKQCHNGKNVPKIRVFLTKKQAIFIIFFENFFRNFFLIFLSN